MFVPVDRNCPEPLPSVRVTVLSQSQGHPASGMVFKNLVSKADSSSFPPETCPTTNHNLRMSFDGCPMY